MSISSKSAFTLAETLFAMVIVTVAVTTSMAALAAGSRDRSLVRDRQIAAQIAAYAYEAFVFRDVPTTSLPRADLECVLASLPGTLFGTVPPAIATRFTSTSGDLERVVATGGQVLFLKPYAGAVVDSSQMRLIFAVVTPAVRNGEFSAGTSPNGVPPGGSPLAPFDASPDGYCADWDITQPNYRYQYKLRPDLCARTLVAWSADWYQYQDCETLAGDANNNLAVDSGTLSPSVRLAARELARFNFYDPHFHISLKNP